MTTKEKYSLTFLNAKLSDGRILPSVQVVSNVNFNNVLSFIMRFKADETSALIYDLNVWIQNQISHSEIYRSDTVEDMTITYSYPNVIIDSWYIIPAVDFKSLLEEWLAFIS